MPKELVQTKNPLVSIIVITYNSKEFVLETLESIKNQTYQNIELIICDDGSEDETISICNNWLKEHSNKFVRSKLITVVKNTGISANCNRGVKESKGEWIKFIAGDDALLSSSIEDVMKHCYLNSNVKVLSTQVDIYKNDFNENSFLRTQPLNWELLKIYNSDTTINKQLEFIFNGGYHYAPGFFIKKEVIVKINYLDESFRLIEDIPLYLKFGLGGVKIEFHPIRTVKYRKSELGITFTNNIHILPKYMLDYYNALYKYSIPFGKLKYVLNCWYNYNFIRFIFYFGNKGIILKNLNSVRLFLQPIRVFNALFKIKNKFSKQN